MKFKTVSNDPVGRTDRTADSMLISKSTTALQGAEVKPMTAQLACMMFNMRTFGSRRSV